MISENIDPETRIIEAANRVFLKYGVDDTTMSQIADEADISRTSLHYYFRNKAHLFQKVLESIQDRVIPTLSEIINADVPVLSKIEMFVNEYIDLIMSNPMIPGFLFMEMQRDAKWIIRLLNVRNLNFDKLKIQLEKEVAEGKINPFKLEERMPNWCCSMTRFYFEEGL
jgi:AcrR family transcriptional regulator